MTSFHLAEQSRRIDVLEKRLQELIGTVANLSAKVQKLERSINPPPHMAGIERRNK